MFSLDQELTLESFHCHLLVGSFLTELTFLNQISIFSRNSNHRWKSAGNFSDNLGHNILELYNILIQTRLTTSKTKRDI